MIEYVKTSEIAEICLIYESHIVSHKILIHPLRLHHLFCDLFFVSPAGLSESMELEKLGDDWDVVFPASETNKAAYDETNEEKRDIHG